MEIGPAGIPVYEFYPREMGMTDLDKMITVPARELRLWRDTLNGEKWSLKHEGESSLTHPWINGGESSRYDGRVNRRSSHCE